MDLDKERMLDWSLKMSLIVSALVVILSLKSGVRTSSLLVRGIISFSSLYGLSLGSLHLFEKFNAPKKNQGLREARGVHLDIAVGLDSYGLANTSQSEDVSKTDYGLDIPGQIEPSLAAGLNDDQKQADIIRRMGWG